MKFTFRIRKILVISATVLGFAIAGVSQPGNTMADFFKGVGSILDAGPALWQKIGKFQASNTAQAVATGTANLALEKRGIKDDILGGRIKDADDMSQRIRKLEKDLGTYQNLLLKFSEEIDESSKDMGNDFRSAAYSLVREKGAGLYDVRDLWKPNDPHAQKEAAERLDEAIRCSEGASKIAVCLKNTIDNGARDNSPACTDQALKDAELACTKEVKGSSN